MIGYRNATYSPQQGTVRVSTWDEEGNRVAYSCSYEPYLMLEDIHGDKTSIFNTKLRKRSFRSQFERAKYVKECGTTRLFENLNPVQQFLIDNYWQHNNDEDFAKHPLRVVTIDIEVDTCKYKDEESIRIKRHDKEESIDLGTFRSTPGMRKVYEVWDKETKQWDSYDHSCYIRQSEFPTAEHARHPINVITIYDNLEDQYTTWGAYKYTHDKPNLTYHHCPSEKQLLTNFVDYFAALECDLLTGYNSEGFDIPYIINRINNLLGEEAYKKLSPVNRVYNRTLNNGLFGKPQIRWYIDGVACVDYLDIYKRFIFSNRESYKLDHIAELELGEKKVDYGNTNLANLAKDDWQKFVDYNVQDVALLVKLDRKLDFIALLRMLSYMGLTTLEGAMSTLSTITGSAAIRARQRKQFLPTFVRHGDDTKNPGAYVAEPLEGFQSNVVSFDANSLYPNIMISLNMSPETKIGEIIDSDEKTVTVKHVNGQEHTLTAEKFMQFVKQEKIAVSKAKILFSQKQKGILPDILDEYYKERVAVREEMGKLKRELSNITKKLANMK